MKRKLKASKSLKGTPPITKFFKRNPDIKAKPLTAVVKICDISPTKASTNNKENKSVQEIKPEIKVSDSKHSARLPESNKEVPYTNFLNSENVKDLVNCEESIVDKKCEENEIEHSLQKPSLQKGPKKCLFNQSDVNHSPKINVSSLLDEKHCQLNRTEKASNVCLNSKTVIENHNGSLKYFEDSKLRSSECKSISAKLSESEKKVGNEIEFDQFSSKGCNSQQFSFTYEQSPAKKAGISCENKVVDSTTDKKTESTGSALTESISPLNNNFPCKEITVPKTSADNIFSKLLSSSENQTVEKLKENMDKLERMETADSVNSREVSGSDCIKTSKENVRYPVVTKTTNMNVGKDSELKDGEDLPRDDRRQSKNINKDDDTSNDLTDSDECDDDSSDEELFNPVAFLCDNRVKPDVRTPEKAATPITGSPFTPVSPYVPQTKQGGVRLKYSLDQLLLEKPKQVEKEKVLAKLQLAMQEAIETGKNADMNDDFVKEHQDDEKALLPIHQKELDKYMSTDKGFTEETPGVNVFPGLSEPVKHKNGCSQPFPVVEAVKLDEFTTFLYQRTDLEIRELLCCDWITHKYLIQPCPPAIVQWLFHILCYHLDNHTIKASYNALWSMLNAGDNKENHGELSWIPSVQNVMDVFKIYGASLTSVLANVCDSKDSLENLINITCKQRDSTDKNDDQASSFFPLVNFTRLIQFITLCLDRYPTSYSSKDIDHLVVMLYCISLDEHMEICQHDIKTCLQAAYAAVQSSDWIEEVIKMSSIIHRFEICHRNKLRIVQLQPYSGRGRDIKRLAALQTLASLFHNITSFNVNRFIRSNPDVNEDKEITDTVEMFMKLETLLQEVNVNDDTDYFQLYTMIELMDIVVGSERLQPPEKAVVDRITKKLRSLHSEIKDPRAMFISRSKVKDLILRTITKFAYMIQGKKGTNSQKTITKFFVEGKSDLHIETLEDSEIVEEEDEHESQESQASSFIMDPLSQTIEHSDSESLPESQEFITRC